MIEAVEPPLEFRRIQAADLSAWDGSTDAPAFVKLLHAIDQKLSQSPAAPAFAPPPTAAAPVAAEAKTPAAKISGSSTSAKSRKPWFVAAGVGAAVLAAAAFFLLSGGGEEGGGDPVADLEALVAEISWTEDLQLGRKALPPPPPIQLPPIDEFPLVVAAPGGSAVVAEIYSSSEKAGTDTGPDSDRWMVEVGEAFNAQDVRLADGRAAKVNVRKIASGVAFEYIKADQSLPDGYSPSNHLWIEMATASGVTMTAIREQLVPNVAGLVLSTEKADELRTTYGTVDASTVVQAVIADDLVMGYTDPFISSTGLNFLITVLSDFAEGDEDAMLNSEVERIFRDFQENVPFVAITTLQLRDSVVGGGQLDAFVMEYQTFIQTDVLSDGFEFIPFGIRHDNPLYAVGQVDAETIEVLELFAAFSERPEFTDLAREYGFDPEPYAPPLDVPTGRTLLKAQELWKDNKDGGRPVTAVFVTDVSGSMGTGSRIEAVRKALNAGVQFIGEDNLVGMVVFNDSVTHVLPIRTFSLEQRGRFAAATDDMRVGGGTAMYDGVAVALKLLLDEQRENPGAKPIVIVLTDGETQDGMSFGDIDHVVAGLRIPIYTIGFEADIDELARLSALVEAVSINASEDDVEFKIARLFNAQL
jgi:Ca-activated chloride channel family protein